MQLGNMGLFDPSEHPPALGATSYRGRRVLWQISELTSPSEKSPSSLVPFALLQRDQFREITGFQRIHQHFLLVRS